MRPAHGTTQRPGLIVGPEPLCQCYLMHVGILGGTGPLGRGLGLRLADAGASVTIGSRDAARAAEVVGSLLTRWPRPLAIEGAGNDGAAAGEVVVVATPWDALIPTLGPLVPHLEGKVVISVANALVKQGREMHALVPPRGSMAAAVQAALPSSLVAAAGHHLPASDLGDLDKTLGADVLVCSDHPEATRSTMALLASVAGLRPLDAGSLAQAAAIEAFTAVLVTLNIRYKAHSSLGLTGLDRV
ncbi:MAG TPA: NADPH-dependent F420 reductase [Acidimicrobiales bacterium]|nr:NADPH-dependent F420 reductase [Acidimicrobiales bacterium]